MTVDVLGFEGTPSIVTRLLPGGFAVLGLYGLLALVLLVRTRRSFARLASLPRASLFAGLLLAAPLLAQVLVVRLRGFAPREMSLTLLGALPLLVAARWLGPGPALLVGALGGLAAAGWDTHRLAQPFEMALWAAAMSLLLRQPYRGRIGGAFRQPLISALFTSVGLAWPLALLALSSAGPLRGLASLDMALALAPSTLLGHAVQALIAGALVQGMLAVLPRLRAPEPLALVPPPWTHSLNRRILFTLAPLTLLAIVVLVSGVALAAYPVATDLVIGQMVRDADTAGSAVPFFVQVGRSLIRDLAGDERLLSERSSVRQARLAEGLRAVPFFQQLVFFDAQGNPANTYPAPDVLDGGLSHEEEAQVRLALDGGIPSEASIYPSEGNSSVILSFVSPVYEPQSGEVVGVLLGRAPLNPSPLTEPSVGVLRDVLVGSGEGLIVDEANTILLYPAHPERQMETLELAGTREIRAGSQAGRVFRQTHDDGTQQLLYVQPIAGHSEWSVVVMVPDQVVLALAARIVLPTLAIVLAIAALGLGAIVTISARLTEPVEALARAAERIAAGRLDQPVQVSGEDEVGRLGLAFEDMRRGLKERQRQQETVLDVSYAVSASLDLYRALPPILSAALEATGALGVRMLLVREDGSSQTYAAGEGAAGMAPMDKELLAHAENQGALVVGRIERASATLKSSKRVPHIQALVALPIRTETVFQGILWLAFEEERQFEEAQLTFLSNLASQASFAVANARLFEAAEGGRRQLAAILTSTSDAVLVVDNKRRLLLTNPAAEQTFGIKAEEVRGKDFADIIDRPELSEVLNGGPEPASLELSHENGQTLLASASPIVGEDGKPLGRAVLLRDITYLKELDQMKSAFVNAVAHDLRAPLTFMSGYITMLPMVGDLNQKQRDFTDKIRSGVNQMSDLIEKLLNLGRIESGVPLDLEACDLKALLADCHASLADAARAKKLTFKLDLPDALPHLPADATLYRQAITNLIENAIKYTPEGGKVTVSASADGGVMTISVKDTGPGISDEAIDRLFQPFFRVKDPSVATIKGSGLGLAIVKGVADRHGGRVRVESKPGKGSTFHLEIPLRRPEP